MWRIRRKRTTYCARKHKQLPPQFAGLETFSQVLVFFLQRRHKKRLLAGENGAGSERNGSIHLLSQSFTVQSYLSGKLQTAQPKDASVGGGVALHWKQDPGYLHARQRLMGLNLANPDCLVGRDGANRPPMALATQSVHCRNPGNVGDPTECLPISGEVRWRSDAKYHLAPYQISRKQQSCPLTLNSTLFLGGNAGFGRANATCQQEQA